MKAGLMTATALTLARKKLGLTQRQMGEALSLSSTWIGLMERGTKPVERRTALSVRYLLEHPDALVPDANVVAVHE